MGLKNMAQLKVKDLLLAFRLDIREVASLLSPYGFKEIERADANLQAMADDPQVRQLLSDIIEELLSCIAKSADPDHALNYLERFTKAAVNKVHLFSYLKETPRTIELLAKTFGGSPFMSEILIRNPLYLYWVSDPDLLYKARKKRDVMQDLSGALKHLKTEERKLEMLRIFKRKEILLIGIRDLLRISDVKKTLSSLSILAEVLIQKAYEICRSSMHREYGIPFHEDPSGKKVQTGFTIIGMGKLGGGELNFSSDVDLVYLYESDDELMSRSRSKDRPVPISKGEYFKQLSQKITKALSDVTSEGYVYRVDLRLRPEGKIGNIAYSLSGFEHYYASRGQTWERLALLKAWPVAGNRYLGMRFLSMVRPFIYDRPFDLKAVSEVRQIKERIDQKMSARGIDYRNVKLGFGGIREIEFIVQSLQISFGKIFPEIVGRNTLKALQAIFKQQLLSGEERSCLSCAYLFLRDIENKLQMVYDYQIHSLPAKAKELSSCALRLGYQDTDQESAAGQLLADYRFHASQVNQIYKALLCTDRPSRLLYIIPK